MDEITRKRLGKLPNESSAWTVEECLEAVLDEVKRKKITPNKCILIMIEEKEDSCIVDPFRAGTNRVEELGYLSLATAMSTAKWRGE